MKYTEHHFSTCPLIPAPCSWANQQEKGPNPHVLFGALVGGPDGNDRFTDSRNNIINNKVTCDYNAGFQGAIAGMFIFKIEIRCINSLWDLTPPHLSACPTPAHGFFNVICRGYKELKIKLGQVNRQNQLS